MSVYNLGLSILLIIALVVPGLCVLIAAVGTTISEVLRTRQPVNIKGTIVNPVEPGSVEPRVKPQKRNLSNYEEPYLCPACYQLMYPDIAQRSDESHEQYCFYCRSSSRKEDSPMSNGWIGVDLDGTVALYDKWVHHTHIGNPIEAMVKRIKNWRAQGHEVRIFTARVYPLNMCIPDVHMKYPIEFLKDDD